MKKNLTTPAGPTDENTSKEERNGDIANAINQVFAIFRRNYHNQYFKAFASEQDASIAKRLWLESLSRFSAETILKGARSIIEKSEFLPTLAAMIRHCEAQNNPGLPDAHTAYIEACRAPSPKNEYAWSHLAVYYAGKESDWYFLQSNTEDKAFPVFKKNYLQLCDRVLNGEKLDPPTQKAIADSVVKPLDKTKNREHLASLKERLKL